MPIILVISKVGLEYKVEGYHRFQLRSVDGENWSKGLDLDIDTDSCRTTLSLL